jgi:hypothetical protein
LRLLLLFFGLACCRQSLACTCPPLKLNIQETEKYDLIFRGTVVSVKPCAGVPGEAVFEIQELYKGNTPPRFSVLFHCDEECALGFKQGEEWIIYTRYKQISNAMMDWCSRSRKFYLHDKEDFYKVNFGNDYFEELRYLRTNLGLHRLLVKKETEAGNRNILPNTTQLAIALLCSIAAIVVFYILFRKFFR